MFAINLDNIAHACNPNIGTAKGHLVRKSMSGGGMGKVADKTLSNPDIK